VTLFVAAFALSSTPSSAQTKLTFLLNVPPAGYNSGFELAVERGLYKEAGLDVTIEPGNGSQTTAQLLAVGKYDIGFADSAPAMKLISQGAKLKILATILQGNPNAVTALKKTGLKSVADIKGRSVAMPTAGSQVSMFPLVLAANNLKESDIELVNMPPEAMVSALIQGTVQVILGSVDQFDIQLKNQGQQFDSFLFIDSGAPTVTCSRSSPPTMRSHATPASSPRSPSCASSPQRARPFSCPTWPFGPCHVVRPKRTEV